MIDHMDKLTITIAAKSASSSSPFSWDMTTNHDNYADARGMIAIMRGRAPSSNVMIEVRSSLGFGAVYRESTYVDSFGEADRALHVQRRMVEQLSGRMR